MAIGGAGDGGNGLAKVQAAHGRGGVLRRSSLLACSNRDGGRRRTDAKAMLVLAGMLSTGGGWR